MVQDATTSPRKSLFNKRTYEAYIKDAVENAVNPSQDETSNSASLSGSDKVVEKRLQKSLHTKNNQMNTNEEGAITQGFIQHTEKTHGKQRKGGKWPVK